MMYVFHFTYYVKKKIQDRLLPHVITLAVVSVCIISTSIVTSHVDIFH